MRSSDNYDNKKVKTNEKEKRSIMYSQIFNYNLMSRDPMMRSVEVTAAVEAGGKDIRNNKAVVYTLLVIAAVFVLCYLRHPVAQAVNKYILEKSEVVMVLEEPEAVAMDIEGGIQEISYGFTAKDGYYYETSYDSWEDIPFENLSIEYAKGNDEFRFTRFDIGTDESRLGVLKIIVKDNSTNKFYKLNGSFKVEDYTSDYAVLVDLGDKATFTYESKNGITAYFIRNWSYGDYTVYFMLDKILFEMEVTASKKSIEVAKQIIDVMID